MNPFLLLFAILTGLTIDLGMAQSSRLDRCPADVVFLLDEASSMTPYNYFTYVIPFMAKLSQDIDLGPDRSHLGVVHFSDEWATAVDFDFTDPKTTNGSLASDYIRHMKFHAGNTAMVMALELAYYKIFMGSGNRRSEWGKSVAAYAVVITNGIATDGDIAPIAYQMNKTGIAVFAIGIGSLVPSSYLVQLTNSLDRIFSVNNFSDLGPQLLGDIEKAVSCPMTA